MNLLAERSTWTDLQRGMYIHTIDIRFELHKGCAEAELSYHAWSESTREPNRDDSNQSTSKQLVIQHEDKSPCQGSCDYPDQKSATVHARPLEQAAEQGWREGGEAETGILDMPTWSQLILSGICALVGKADCSGSTRLHSHATYQKSHTFCAHPS